MKSIYIVFALVSEKIQSVSYDEEILVEGIKQYVEENHLADWDETVKDEKIFEEMVCSYMSPLLRMSPEAVVDYFEYYDTLQKFTKLTNSILGLAEAAYYKKPIEEDVNEKERALIVLSKQLYESKTLRKTTDMAVSEALLNIDYIRGNRSKLSMSLKKRVNL